VFTARVAFGAAVVGAGFAELAEGDVVAVRFGQEVTAVAEHVRPGPEPRTAARIAAEEKFSLSVLATRIGVSKARADQLIKSVKDADQGSEQEGEGTVNA
jgi:hypothetical protein